MPVKTGWYSVFRNASHCAKQSNYAARRTAGSFGPANSSQQIPTPGASLGRAHLAAAESHSATMAPSVRFADSCLEHEGAVLDVDDVVAAELWFQHTELKQIKQRAMILAREAGPLGLNSLLTNTYGRTDKDTKGAVISWGLKCSARRGLERFANRDYAVKRSDVRSRTIKSVLKAQRKLREDGIKDTEYKSIVLGRLSEAFSREAVNTAQALGDADQAAASAVSQRCLALPNPDNEDRRNKMERTLSPTTVLDVPCPASTVTQPSKSSPIAQQRHRFYKAVNTPTREMFHFC